ncbi:MAG: hypothetical protein IJU23_13185 [Proteobacteria bacterium]|nr:hypothetical protein [Pseudomonadota bacterium]
MTRRGLGRGAIKAKYSLENSMFEIRDEPKQGKSDFEFISRNAIILWIVVTVICLLSRALG